MNFTSIDARILYAIYQPKQKVAEVSFRDVIAFSDYIDHSVLMYEELSTSLGKLLQAELIELMPSAVKATPVYKKWMTASYKNKKPVSIHKKMTEIETYLNGSFAFLPIAIEGIEVISRAEFDRAVDDYLGRS